MLFRSRRIPRDLSLNRLAAMIGEEELCLRLLEDRGVAVHPGLFFGFPSEGYLVISLLPPETVFSNGASSCLDEITKSADYTEAR